MPQIGTALQILFTGGSAAAGGWLATSTAASFSFGTALTQLLSSVALSALQAALVEEPRPAGIVTERTLTGDVNPASFVVGSKYKTAGAHVCPPMTHGQAGNTPNAYLNYVINFGDLPHHSLEELYIDDEKVTIGATEHADYGFEIEGDFDGYAWVKFYDGTQTAADPMLLAQYPVPHSRPWTADMILEGISYAVLTFRFNRDLYSSLPRVHAAIGGIPLYDPRKDDTAGGTGAHRWDDQSTWERSDNFAVVAYNIHRGISIGDYVWGGNVSADRVPFDHWVAAMNTCDEIVFYSDPGLVGQEMRYRTSYEIRVNEKPKSVLRDMARGCNAEFAEVAGEFFVRVGEPAVASFYTDDDDQILEYPIEFIPTQAQVHKAIHAACPDPKNGWEPTDLPPVQDADFVADDDTANLKLPATPYPYQAQRVMREALNEELNRQGQLSAVFGPHASAMRIFDVFEHSSPRWNFSDESFEVRRIEIDTTTLHTQVMARAKSSIDFDLTGYEPTPVPEKDKTSEPKPVCVMPPLSGTGGVISQTDGSKAVPALFTNWPTPFDGVTKIQFEYRLKGETDIQRDETDLVENGAYAITKGIVSNGVYEYRQRGNIGPYKGTWSDWYEVTAGDARIPLDELGDDVAVTAKYTQGGNQIQNSRFRAGLYNWHHTGSGAAHDDTTLLLRAAGLSWAGKNYPTLAMSQSSADASGYSLAQCGYISDDGVAFNDGFPVEPGQWVGVAAKASSHRCSGDVRLVFRNASGALISAHDADIADDVQSSSDNPEEWPLYWVHAEAPAGAARAQLWIQKWFTTSGSSSWLFIHKPYSFTSRPGLTEPPEWQPEGIEIIRPPQISGGLVVYRQRVEYAEKLVNADVTPLEITIDDVQSDGVTAKAFGAITKDGSNGGTADWALEATNSDYFDPVFTIDSGSFTVPSGVIADWGLEISTMGYSGRALEVGDTVRLRLFNVTGSFMFEGHLLSERAVTET